MNPRWLPLSRLALGVLTAVIVVSSARAQRPAEELIGKLLDLAKAKKKVDVSKADDELRRLLGQRYNVAVEQLADRCEDFKKQVATKQMVVEAGKDLLQAELELQTTNEGRLKVLTTMVELMRWYEGRLELALKAELIPKADLLRVRYVRLSFEIDVVKMKRAMGK